MILKLKLFQAIFCASLPNRSAIASLCKTSPIKAPESINGKELTNRNKSIKNNLDNINCIDNIKTPILINSTQKIEPELNTNAQIKPKSLSDFITRKDVQQQSKQVDNKTNITNNGEHHAINQPSTTSDNSSNRANQEQKTSTSKSNYLF